MSTDTIPTITTFLTHVAEATTEAERAAVIAEGLALVAEAEAGTGLLTFQTWQGMGTVADASARAARAYCYLHHSINEPQIQYWFLLLQQSDR